MIVVDVNVIAYLFIAGDKTALAQAVFQKDPDWQAPRLWQHEFLNILATYVRAGGGRYADAFGIWQTAVRRFEVGTHEVQMAKALQLACEHTVSAYDAQYVVLAQDFGAPLISEDQRLQRTFPGAVLSMQSFSEVS